MASSKNSFFYKLGDAIERLGEKLSKSGSSKWGKKVYDFGNKMEHSNESSGESKLNKN